MYPSPETQRKKFRRLPVDDKKRRPTPESLRHIQRDNIYHILHPAQ